MPNASTYQIDVANIRPGGSTTKGLYVGSTESKYALLGDKCIYDKVLYELSINDITVEPNAQTVEISPHVTKNTRTHGNTSADTLSITPSAITVTANQDTANTRNTSSAISQSITLNGNPIGTAVTVTVTQKADYPTAISFTISPKTASVIPASGGSISSALSFYDYEVLVDFKSGRRNINVTSDCTIRANKLEVSAETLGNTETSTANVVGYITFTATYAPNPNGSVSQDVIVGIKQAANHKYTNWGTVNVGNATLSCNDIPITGGTVTPSTGGTVTQNYKYYYDSTYEDPTWNNVDITSTARVSYNPASITRGTNAHNTSEVDCGSIVATWTGNSDVTATKSIPVKQLADYGVWSSSSSSMNVIIHDSSHVPYTGGTKTVTVGLTRTHTYVWASDLAIKNYETDGQGTMYLTSLDSYCTLSQSTAVSGDTFTATIDANNGGQRSVTFNVSSEWGDSNTLGWTQDGPSLLTPSFTWVTLAFASDPEPTPTNPTVRVYCTNSLPIGVTLGLATGNSFYASELIASGNVAESSSFEHACTAEIQSITHLYLWIKTATQYQIGGSMVSHSKFYTWNNSNGGSTPGTNMNPRWLDSGWLLLDAGAGYVTNFNTETYDVTITLFGQ